MLSTVLLASAETLGRQPSHRPPLCLFPVGERDVHIEPSHLEWVLLPIRDRTCPAVKPKHPQLPESLLHAAASTRHHTNVVTVLQAGHGVHGVMHPMPRRPVPSKGRSRVLAIASNITLGHNAWTRQLCRYGSLGPVDVVADMQLRAVARTYRLPGTGSRSMLFRFDEVEGQPMFRAIATASDRRDFELGHSFAGVHLWFWGDVEGHITIEPGARFVVWCGSDIGEGTVQSC
jgi:hypothetical protein